MQAICPLCIVLWDICGIFIGAAFGVAVLHVVNLLNRRQPFSVLSALQVDLNKRPLMILSDIVISSLIGAVLVMAFFRPATSIDAVIGGLGITGVLSAIGKDTP